VGLFSGKKAFSWKNKYLKLRPTQTIALAFLGIILLGMILLSLPAASRDGKSCGLLGALFTATSATCVTGLVMFDTWSQFSGFGQGVILGLIEIGGLGFMSAASIVVFLMRRKVGLKQRMLMAQALSLNEMEGVVRLQKYVLVGSLGIQMAGALVLFLRFLPAQGVATAAWWGVFHAISAFCNAGFDILGSIAPGASISVLNHDPVVCITLMVLIVLGGLGFFVWEEMVRIHNWKKFSVYTKLVLTTSIALILSGAVAFCLLEWNNPGTFGTMTPGQKILNGFFQSVTVRTAGFASVDQALLTDAGKGVSMLLMLIGGSSGSTAGGLKTVTLVVLLLFMWSRARGRQTVCVFKHSIPTDKVLDAVSIATILIGLSMFGALFISATSPIGFTESLFESVSALATVGLTAGATVSLSIPAKILIIIYMYFGRVGVLTISLGFLMGDKAQERFRYAYTNVLIG
jgi:trk system potassium uptake protein TrkH